MGWDGRKDNLVIYNSSSVHAFIVDGRIKGVIVMVFYSKSCRNFIGAKNRGQEAEKHEFPKNLEGISKCMEYSVIMKIVEDAFYNQFLSFMS